MMNRFGGPAAAVALALGCHNQTPPARPPPQSEAAPARDTSSPDAGTKTSAVPRHSTWNGTACVDSPCAVGQRFLGGRCVHSDGMACVHGCYPEDWPEATPLTLDCRTVVSRTAYEALIRVALGECKSATGSSGTGVVRVTFGTNGEVEEAAVAHLPPGNDSSLTCLRERLRRVRIPSFDGEPLYVPLPVLFR